MVDDQIRAVALYLRGDRFGTGDMDEISARPERGFRCEGWRAGVGPAADHQQLAVVALVTRRVSVALLEAALLDVTRADEPLGGRRDADIRDGDFGVEFCEPGFSVVEGDDVVSVNGDARGGPGVGVDPGGNIDGDNLRVGGVDRASGARLGLSQRARDAGAEHRVDDTVG